MEKSQTIIKPEHLERQERAAQLLEDVRSGAITDVQDLDPRETSIEVVQQARGIMRELGLLARINTQSGL